MRIDVVSHFRVTLLNAGGHFRRIAPYAVTESPVDVYGLGVRKGDFAPPSDCSYAQRERWPLQKSRECNTYRGLTV